MGRDLYGATVRSCGIVGVIFILVVVVGALAACSAGAASPSRTTVRTELDEAIAARLPARGVLVATTTGNGVQETVVFDADEGRAELHTGAASDSRTHQLAVSRTRELWALAMSTRREAVPPSSHSAAFRRRLFIVDGDDVFEASFDGPRLPPSSAAGLVAEMRTVAGLP
jgi:hypothetical protein